MIKHKRKVPIDKLDRWIKAINVLQIEMTTHLDPTTYTNSFHEQLKAIRANIANLKRLEEKEQR